MELFSKKFIEKVSNLFADKDSRIICTVPISKGRPIPLVEDIKQRSDAALLTVVLQSLTIGYCITKNV